MHYNSISTISNNTCTQLLFLKIKRKHFELIDSCVHLVVEIEGIKVMRLPLL
jgi:hypothetical protein